MLSCHQSSACRHNGTRSGGATTLLCFSVSLSPLADVFSIQLGRGCAAQWMLARIFRLQPRRGVRQERKALCLTATVGNDVTDTGRNCLIIWVPGLVLTDGCIGIHSIQCSCLKE